jgi:BR serine/threonine kinase
MAIQMIGDFVVVRDLGIGSTGKVKLARHAQTGVYRAIKILKKSHFDRNPDSRLKTYREIALMRLLNHPHILKLVDVCESTHHLYIVLEYAEHGELFELLCKHKFFRPEIALAFFRQLIYGLEYLHTHSICHRDLKPENILLTEMNEVKIADFGFARWMKENIADTSCGSPHYAAPEVVRGTPYDGCAADIWSSGVILFALLSGRLPFYDPIVRNLLTKVKAGQFVMPDFLPDVQHLVSGMLTVDPAQRITLEQIKQHPAFRLGLLDCPYIHPTPLPIPARKDPIDFASIPSGVLQVLRHVGYFADEELREELEAAEPSMAKVFYHMLTSPNSLDCVPWEEAKLPDVIELPEDAFACRGDLVQPCVDIPLAPEELLAKMQAMLTALGFQWFHPDDYRLFARLPGARAQLTVTVKLQSVEFLSMDVHFRNATPAVVGLVSERLRDLLASA